VEIRDTQDDSDVRLPVVITGAGLGGYWVNTRTTHQEYRQYEYGNAQGLQISWQQFGFNSI